MQLIECVPKFSEGRDKDKIAAITSEISAVEGVTLLDVDPGADTNRTVVTFIGEPNAVEEAARDGGDLDGTIRELDNILREANTTFDSRNEILAGVA